MGDLTGQKELRRLDEINDLNIQVLKTEGLLLVADQAGPHSEFKTILGYRERPHLKNKATNQ